MEGNDAGQYGRGSARYRSSRSSADRSPAPRKPPRSARQTTVTRRPAPKGASGDASRFLCFAHLLRLAAVAIVLAAAVSFASGLSLKTYGDWPSLIPKSESSPTSQPTSQPASQWRKGEVPRLYQTDPAWASEPYAGGTVAENGCGPTCLTMAYICLTGSKDYDPASMCKFSESNGHVDSGMTSWSLMGDGVQQLGLKSEELPADVSALREALDAGHPVILSMGPGDFTTTGHFIVAVGMDESGRLTVRDPNSPKRTAQEWDASQVLRQCRNLWEISR